MESELRWILLALSAVLLVGIWWWGVRRSRQAPGNAHLRETGAGAGSPGPTILGPTIMSPTPGQHPEDVGSREWGVPPFEPLSIHTADFDERQVMDLPMSATAPPLDMASTMEFVEHESPGHPDAGESLSANPGGEPGGEPGGGPDAEAQAPPRAEVPAYSAEAQAPPRAEVPAYSAEVPVHSPEGPTGADSWSAARAAPAKAPAASAAASASNTAETQRIVTVRVCAVGDAHWPGAELLAALQDQGLKFGRYKVFHRLHHDGRTLFCAASLVEPGSFDIARMPDDEFRGVTLFAVLPGPADALETIDTLIATAVNLADTLHGAVQDAKGAPLSAQRAEALREDVAHFQQSL